MKKRNNNKISAAFARMLAAILLITVAIVAVSCSRGGSDKEETSKSGSIEISGGDIEVNIGEDIDYEALVYVTDKADPAPVIDIDYSSVDVYTPGTYQVVYTVSDSTGNSAEHTLNVTVVDVTPPEITGGDFTIMAGDSVSYKKQITVKDDSDPDPVIEVDNSTVDLDTPGVYEILYTVTDASGNASQLTVKMNVLEKTGDTEEDLEEFYRMQEYVTEEAANLLSEITDDSMSDIQKAFAIYNWSKYNIGYAGSSDKTNYIVGAYEGLTKRQGDCYTYFAVSKALLEAAGIDNIDVVKERIDDSQSRHYWSLVNVGEGWYHFDSTPYTFPGDNFFMVTDSELKAWDESEYPYSHNYISDGMPELATESIQYRIDYGSGTVED